MKKIMSVVSALVSVFAISTSVISCPLWSCQYDVNDYSCGCNCNCNNDYSYSSSNYNYSSNDYYCNYGDGYVDEVESCNYQSYTQPIYCQYCGNEMWACTCNNNYYESNYDTSNCYSSYSSNSSTQMDHWANVRDCYGNIVGQVGEGSNVEVCGIDSSNPDRVLIYDYSTGTYGSVLSECVYGGYQWDGSGCNGYYNQYHGSTNSSTTNTCSNTCSNTNYEVYEYDTSAYDSTINDYDNYTECSAISTGCSSDSYIDSSYDECYSNSYNNSYSNCYNYSPCVEYIEISAIIRHYESYVNSCMSNYYSYNNNNCCMRSSNFTC